MCPRSGRKKPGGNGGREAAELAGNAAGRAYGLTMKPAEWIGKEAMKQVAKDRGYL